MFKKPCISQYLRVATNQGSKFKLDCVESKNSYIVLINGISFKLRLINFVYFL